MGTAFRRSRGGGVTATLHVAEADLLRSLVGQLLSLVTEGLPDPGAGGPDAPDPLSALLDELGEQPARPADPVLLRLFPDGYRDDEEGAGDFRRYTERRLRESKADRAQRVLASLEAVRGTAGPSADPAERVVLRLDRSVADAWLRTLTDLRLALGTRLGVAEGDEARWAALPEDDPARYVHDVYDWLGWLQETLVRAMSGRRR